MIFLVSPKIMDENTSCFIYIKICVFTFTERSLPSCSGTFYSRRVGDKERGGRESNYVKNEEGLFLPSLAWQVVI